MQCDHFHELTVEDVTVNLRGHQSSIQIGDLYSVPIHADGSFTIYHGTKGIFPRLDYAAIALSTSRFNEMAEKLDAANAEALETLRTNAVLIGYDQEAARQYSLPNGDRVSRGEVLAMAVATIQSGRHITSWPNLYRLISLAILVLAGLYLFRGSRLKAVGGAILLFLIFAAASIGIFQMFLSWSPPWTALAICGILFLLGLVLPGSARKTKQEPSSEEQTGKDSDSTPGASAT